MTAIQILADVIAAGTAASDHTMLAAMRGLFGERFHRRSGPHVDIERPPFIRNAYGRGGAATEHVAYAGFIHPDNPPSGPYGGTSLVWFPSAAGCLIDFGIGTRGLSPDEGILTRPGHRRRIASLRRYLVSKGVKTAWARQDPANTAGVVPELITKGLQEWDAVFKRYGNELYCLAVVPRDNSELAREVVQAFVDLYAYERGWEVLKSAEAEFRSFIAGLNAGWLATPGLAEISALLQRRRFVVLEGPPGTGKTRVAQQVLNGHYAGNGLVTQFHPSTTYEDFVVGLSPDVAQDTLRFTGRAPASAWPDRLAHLPQSATGHRPLAPAPMSIQRAGHRPSAARRHPLDAGTTARRPWQRWSRRSHGLVAGGSNRAIAGAAGPGASTPPATP